MKKRMVWVIAALVLAGCAALQAGPGKADSDVLLKEDFSDGNMDGWWVEGGEKVWVEDGRLHIKADPPENRQPGYVCTVWYKKKFEGDIEILFDAHVVASAIDANNINFFWDYTYPEKGKTIWETRGDRPNAGYKKYHNLNGYIVTFLNDFQKKAPLNADGSTKARLRMRRCLGFKLVDEKFAYECKIGKTYHCKVVTKGGHLEFWVDGKKYLEYDDPNPWKGGLIGLRTFRTHLWWDNIEVRRIK